MALTEREELELLELEARENATERRAQPERRAAPEMGLLEKIGRGALGGAAELGQGILSLPKVVGLPPVGGEDFMQRSIEGRKTLTEGAGVPGQIAGMATQMAGTAGLGGVRGVTMLPRVLRPIAEGALGGLVTSPEAQGMGAGVGAIGGGVAGSASRLMGGLIPQTPTAARLEARGVPVTAGQGADPTSMMGRAYQGVESGSTYLPVVGRMVQRQRDMPTEVMRVQTAKVTDFPPQHAQLQTYRPGPKDTIDQQVMARKADYENAYTNAANGKSIVVPQDFFDVTLANIQRQPKTHVLGKERRDFNNTIEQYLRTAVNESGGVVDGPTLMSVRSRLGEEAAGAVDKKLRRAYYQAQKELDKLIAVQEPQLAQFIKDLAPGYHALMTMEEAAKKASAEGAFSSRQLANAAQKTGNRPLREMARAIEATAPTEKSSRYQSAISAGLLTLGGGGALFGPEGTAGAMAGTLAPAALLMGTRGGQRFLRGDLPYQQMMGQRLRQFAPSAGVLSGIPQE